MSRSRRRKKQPQKPGVRSTRIVAQRLRPRANVEASFGRRGVDRRILRDPPVLFRGGRSVKQIVSAARSESTASWKAPDYFGRATVLRVMGEPSREKLRTVCSARHERRAVLFAQRVAGENRRRSPGQGGSYRRREESKIKCR